MRCAGSSVAGLCSHRKEDSLGSLIHLSWDVRAAWMEKEGDWRAKEKWMDFFTCLECAKDRLMFGLNN